MTRNPRTRPGGAPADRPRRRRLRRSLLVSTLVLLLAVGGGSAWALDRFALLLSALTGLGVGLLLAKVATEVVLYLASFQVQRRFVFVSPHPRVPARSAPDPHPIVAPHPDRSGGDATIGWR
ncbi:hypothetical protein [Cellulosimicrobium cellulans]|uniref:hypothetical protein n=1 Tax=Cellulosimicrobium cellulans TaxID=1710 RepID=UPI00130DA098|nr:hypothetical protein [Cellulosimicrobium cellulans]